MTGVLLISNDNYYADKAGSVSWGPASDKAWLRSVMVNETIIVGHRTFESIRQFEGLMCLPKKWLVDTRNKVYSIPNAMRFCKDCQEAFPADSEPTYNFGGPRTILKYKPTKLIIHKTYDNLDGGLKLPDNFFDGYVLQGSMREPEYMELVYVKE